MDTSEKKDIKIILGKKGDLLY